MFVTFSDLQSSQTLTTQPTKGESLLPFLIYKALKLTIQVIVRQISLLPFLIYKALKPYKAMIAGIAVCYLF